MKKRWLILFTLLLALALSACQPGSAATVQALTAPAGTAAATDAAAVDVGVVATAAVDAAAAATHAAPAQPTVEPTTAFEASGPAKCTAASGSVLGTPDPTQTSAFPKVQKQDWINGPEDAKVTFIVYSDYQCPYCAQLAPVLTQLRAEFPGDVRVVFRPFPLSIHDKALLADQAAEAAGKQGKYFEYGDAMFAAQSEWSNGTADDFTTWAAKLAEKMGLDAAQFKTDMASDAIVRKAQSDQNEGTTAQVPGTPFMLINGSIYQGPRDYYNLSIIVKLVVMEKQQFSACPQMAIDPSKQYVATIKTDQGDIVINLYAKQAPMTVNNFVYLAQQGWFDNTIFHRVLPGFVAQAGDPSGTGYGSPGYAFSNEVTPELRFDKEGLVGMANAGPDSNGSQFFITLAPARQLDGQYTIFGQVIQGIDVVKKLTPRDPSQSGTLPEGSKILTVTIEEN
jgi:cyclophilin family peptidyl-prolyl cis-trans isomerase/protein-disulfide isomerase